MTKLVSENIFAMALSSYQNLPHYGTITCIWLILYPTLVYRWSTWFILLIYVTIWGLLKISIEDPLSSMVLLLRSYYNMMSCSSFDLIYQSPTILLNTCVNRLCSWMKICVPVVHDLTADIFYSSYLFDCVFLFPDCD